MIAVNCATNFDINNKSNNYSDFLDIQLKDVCKLKNHTCGKGGAHLTVSFWHLFMNLKNNYLLKTVEIDQQKMQAF